MVKYSPGAGGALLPVLSASSASLWKRCNRAWGHRYIDELFPPPRPSQALGSSVHEFLERIRLGTLTGPEAITAQALPDSVRLAYKDALTRVRRVVKAFLAPGLLPPVVPGEQVESAILVEGAHALWRGYIDLRQPLVMDPAPHVWVGDYKTTSDIKYALTPEALRVDDLQAPIYAHAALEDEPRAEYAALQWTYVPTRGKAVARPVRAQLTRAEARDRFTTLDAGPGAEIARVLAQGARSTDLAQEWSACDDYGGCPYRDRCGPRPVAAALEALFNMSDTTQQTLFQQLGGQAPAVQATAPAQAPTVPSSPALVYDPAAWPEKEVKSVLPAAPAPSTPAQASSPFPAPVPNPFAQATTPTRVNPPGSPAPAKYPELYAAAGAPVAAGVQAPEPTPPPAVPVVGHVTPIQGPAPAITNVGAWTQPQAVEQDWNPHEAPRRDHALVSAGPVESTTAPCTEGGVWSFPQTPPLDPISHEVPATPPASAPATAAPSTEAPAPSPDAPTESRGFLLAIGCVVLRYDYTRGYSFDVLVARAHELIRENVGVEDYRLLEYGKGPGAMRRALLMALDELQLGDGAYLFVPHFGPEWAIAGSEFQERAGIIVRSVAA